MHLRFHRQAMLLHGTICFLSGMINVAQRWVRKPNLLLDSATVSNSYQFRPNLSQYERGATGGKSQTQLAGAEERSRTASGTNPDSALKHTRLPLRRSCVIAGRRYQCTTLDESRRSSCSTTQLRNPLKPCRTMDQPGLTLMRRYKTFSPASCLSFCSHHGRSTASCASFKSQAGRTRMSRRGARLGRVWQPQEEEATVPMGPVLATGARRMSALRTVGVRRREAEDDRESALVKAQGASVGAGAKLGIGR